jgi:hypothetical protein
MHHYRCQNVDITSTGSERIVDTLDFPPFNSPMPQISSTDRLLVVDYDINDALKNPHTDVTFATIGGDTITALTAFAALFINKFKKPLAPEIKESPIKAAKNKHTAARIQPIITSPAKHNYHTRSHTEVNQSPANVIESQLPRVVTPVARSEARPRVTARARNLSLINLSQEDFLDM